MRAGGQEGGSGLQRRRCNKGAYLQAGRRARHPHAASTPMPPTHAIMPLKAVFTALRTRSANCTPLGGGPPSSSGSNNVGRWLVPGRGLRWGGACGWGRGSRLARGGGRGKQHAAATQCSNTTTWRRRQLTWPARQQPLLAPAAAWACCTPPARPQPSRGGPRPPLLRHRSLAKRGLPRRHRRACFSARKQVCVCVCL